MGIKRCPKCNGIIVEKGASQTDSWDDYIILLHRGRCHECGTPYEWESYYKWSFDDDPQEA